MAIITPNKLALKGMKRFEATDYMSGASNLPNGVTPAFDFSEPKEVIQDKRTGQEKLNDYRRLTNYFETYNNVNSDDRKEFESTVQLPGNWNYLTNEQRTTLFQNRLYAELFGLDDFETLTKQERDEKYRNAIAPYVAYNVFKGISPEKEALIATMTPEGQLDMLRAYRNGEIVTNEEEADEKIDEIASDLSKGYIDLGNGIKYYPAALAGKLVGQGVANSLLNIIWGKRATKKLDRAEDRFQELVRKDFDRKLTTEDGRAAYETEKNNLLGDYQRALDTDSFNLERNGVRTNALETFEKALDKELSKSRYYQAYKNDHALEDFSITDKIETVAKTRALNDTYSEADANVFLEGDMHKKVFDGQSWGRDWLVNTAKQVVVGGAANTANIINGVVLLGYAAVDQIQTWANGQESMLFENRLLGRDAEGNSLLTSDGIGSFFNPYYWSKVEEYNTFDPNEIIKADSLGGISRWQNVYTPYEQQEFKWNWAQVANESLAMTKFLWSTALMMAVGGGATRLGSAAVGGRFMNSAGKAVSALSKEAILNPQMSNAFARGLNQIGNYGLAALSATGVSEAYGMQVFNQAYQENMQAISDRKIQDMQAQYQNYVDTQYFEDYTREYERLKAINDNKELTKIKVSDEELKKQAHKNVNDAWMAAARARIDAKYAEAEDVAAVKAANAYMWDATIEGIRMAPTNALFRGFLFDKGTRAAFRGNNSPFLKDLVTRADGTLGITSKAGKTALEVGKAVGSGFTSNYFDDVWVKATTALGVTPFTNYMEHKYNPSAYAHVTSDWIGNMLPTVDSYLSSYQAFKRGIAEGMVDPQSAYDGFIGAAGMVFGGMPKLGWIRNGLPKRNGMSKWETLKADLAEGNTTIPELLNRYWSVGALDTWANTNALYREDMKTLEEANKSLPPRYAVLDKMTETIASMNEWEAAKQNGDILTIKDRKARAAFTLAQTLMTNDPVVSQSAKLQNGQKLLEDIANDNVSEERALELINQFKNQPQNKNVADISNEEAWQTIKKNAQTILDMQSSIREVEEIVKKSSLSNTLSGSGINDVITQLAFTKVMQGNWESRLSQIEEEIKGSKQQSKDSYYTEAVIGSKKSLAAEIKANETSQEEYKKEIERATKNLERYRNTAKKSLNLNTRERARQKARVQELLLERYKNILNLLEIQRSKLGTLENSEFNNVLSASEILNLDAKSRARMLNPKNLGFYSKEQQLAINEALTELKNKDASLVQSAQDAATLVDRIEDAKKSFATIMDNPAEALTYVQDTKEQRYIQVQKMYREFEIDKKITELETAPDEETFRNLLKSNHSEVLKEYVKRWKDQETDIQPYIERSEYLEKLFTIVDNLIGQNTPETLADVEALERQARHLKGNLYTLTKQADTVEEVIDALENAIDNPELPEGLRNQIDEILETSTQIQMQRNATKVAEREQKAEKQKAIDEKAAKDKQEAEILADKVADKVETPKQVEELKEEPVSEEGASSTDEVEEALKDADEIVDITNSDASMPVGEEVGILQSSSLIGNAMRVWETGTEVKRRVPEKEGDSMSQYMEWMDAAGIHLQEIIDNELGDIKQFNPTVHFLTIKPDEKSATKDHYMQNHVLLVVEATDAVKRLHNESRGGIIKANGKEWLTIGVAGYDGRVPEQKQTWFALKDKIKRNRKAYFDAHPTERFTVDPNNTTEIKEMTTGRIVSKLENDSKEGPLRLSQLLYNEDGSFNEERNPQHLHWEDLRFGIAMETKFAEVGKMQGQKFYPNRGGYGVTQGVGNVYVMVQAANKAWIPIEIRPITSNEIAEGKLKSTITQILRELTASTAEERKNAWVKLHNYLVMTDEHRITFGDENTQELAIIKNGQTEKHFILNDAFNPQDFINAVFDSGFRIQLSSTNLKSVEYLKMLDEAGALTTEAAKLGTYNSYYSIYSVGADGRAYKVNPVSNADSTVGGKSSVTNFRNNSVMVSGITYRSRDGVYYNVNDGRIVSDQNIIRDIETVRTIDTMTSIAKDGNYDVYVISSDKSNPEVVGKDSSNRIKRYSREQALEYITKMEDVSREAAMNNAAPIENVNGSEQQSEVVVKEDSSDSNEKINEPVEKVNGIGKKSLKDLHNSENLLTFVQFARSPEHRARLNEVLTRKFGADLPTTTAERKKFLEKLNIPTENITNFDAWCDMVINCR